MPEMTSQEIIRAWKDAEYRDSLPQEVRDQLPPAPENVDALGDEELEAATGGMMTPVVPMPNPVIPRVIHELTD